MTVDKGCGRPAYIVLVFLVVGYLAWQWSETLGGAAGLSAKFGGMAPLVTIPLHLLLSATPFPSETIGVGNGALYGLWVGTLYGWLAWWGGSMLEYGIARRSVKPNSETLSIPLPRWLQSVPTSSPLFLIVGRFLPLGYHAVNIAAGIKQVSLWRHTWCSLVSNLIYSFAMSSVGIGLISL